MAELFVLNLASDRFSADEMNAVARDDGHGVYIVQRQGSGRAELAKLRVVNEDVAVVIAIGIVFECLAVNRLGLAIRPDEVVVLIAPTSRM